MNDPTLIGPCADYEHDLIDLQDGELAPERARTVRIHLGQCARCSAWAAGFATIDARLATAITSPALSPGFDARLRQRIASLEGIPGAGDLRTRLEREHAALVESLRSGAWLLAALGAAGSVATTLGVLVASRPWLELAIDRLPALAEGSGQPAALSTLAAVVAVVAIAWSVARGGLPLPGAGR